MILTLNVRTFNLFTMTFNFKTLPLMIGITSTKDIRCKKLFLVWWAASAHKSASWELTSISSFFKIQHTIELLSKYAKNGLKTKLS
jgi:hypothetical protein